MVGYVEVGLFFIAVAVFLIIWLFSWLTHTDYPEHICHLCGKRFQGPRAADLADECEADHMHGGDKP